jgi:hypothetical protein
MHDPGAFIRQAMDIKKGAYDKEFLQDRGTQSPEAQGV